MRHTRRWATAAVGVLGLAAVSVGSGRMLFFLPPNEMGVPVACTGDAPAVPTGQTLTVLVWNIQFSAGRGQEFFYDNGEAVSVPTATVSHTLDEIAAVIQDSNADIVLLQEVDRDSRRTGRIDQHRELLARLDYGCHTSTPYHRAPYVPHPSHEHLGRVDMHLSVFSRYKLGGAIRHQLPMLQESAVRRVFNLKRAVLEVALPLEGGGELVLFNTHLSAFSRGDGTLAKQVALLESRAAQTEDAGHPWVLAGDMNSLPPGDDPSRLEASAQALYAESVTPVQPLFDRFASPVPAGDWRTKPEQWRTYLPFGASAPDRTLDYVFHGSGITTDAFEVLHDASAHSDHLPMLLKIRVGV